MPVTNQDALWERNPTQTVLVSQNDFVSEVDIRVAFYVCWLFLFEDNFVLSYSLIKVIFELNTKVISVEIIDKV